jgi:hypothetical protein
LDQSVRLESGRSGRPRKNGGQLISINASK